MSDKLNIVQLRRKYIKAIDKDKNLIKQIPDELFNIGLNMYSKEYSLDSAIFNSFATSLIDESIVLHKEQLNIISTIENNNAVIISAPTSFGKTFCVFEYIARKKPDSIVLVVPTLALVDEYLKKIIKKYINVFEEYKVYINYDEKKEYDFTRKNLFILTHDKVVECKLYNNLKKIDLLVIDEVYKLKTDINNDRILVLNMAYKYLSEISSKYVLLAPFIGDIEDREELNKKPILYKSDFSPVVNDLYTLDIKNEKDREKTALDLLKTDLKNQKNLIYFSKVTDLSKFVQNSIQFNYDIIENNNIIIDEFIKWAKNEIHEEWYLIKAMERGFLVHNGQLPIGIRIMQIDLYENTNVYNNMLCTSTLLEGVNVCSKNIIITKPQRNNSNFDAFDFYNLVGRTGRLNKHYLGNAFYLKGPDDRNYIYEDAIKTIKFELTDKDSIDFEIVNGNYENKEEFVRLLQKLGIEYQDYMDNIGYKYRFSTIEKLYYNYEKNYLNLLNQINKMRSDATIGRYYLISQLLKIIYGDESRWKVNNDSKIISYSIHKNRYNIKYIVSQIIKKNPQNIDSLISAIIRIKYSSLEHEIYSKVKIIIYFLKCSKVSDEQINFINEKIIIPIEMIYFSNSEIRKNLKSIGIYEKDIDYIVGIIGDKYEDIESVKKVLKSNEEKLKKISFISKYIISQL